MIRIFFLSQSSPILELFPFDKITLKSYICTVVTVMAKQCWSQTVLESGSWGHSVLFSGKTKKNISKCCMLNLVSADNLNIFVFFPRKQNLTFHANCLQMSNVYWKKNKLSPICCLLKMSRVLTINFQQMTFFK